MTRVFSRLLLLFVFVSISGFLKAEEENRCKAVVGIVVSQFLPEWLDMYSMELSESGFKRILDGGKQLIADYGYLFSQTGTDHATIATGTYPYEHGIICHSWYDRVKMQYCSNVGDSLTPENMNALSLSAYMKMNNSFSRCYSVGFKSEEALMSGGTYANNVMWFDNDSGKIVSSGFYGEDPLWLKDFNSSMNCDSILKSGWVSLEKESQLKRRIINKIASRFSSDFYYDLQHLKNESDSYVVMNVTPFANDIITDLACEVIRKERIGMDNEPDLLMVNLSSLDYMNRDFSLHSHEFRDLVLRMDADLEQIFSMLDTKCGKGNYTLFFTFSEARELMPEDYKAYKLKSDYFSIYRAIALLKSYMRLVYGEGTWILTYDAGQIYLNKALISEKKLSLASVQRVVADFLVDFEGINKAVTATELNLMGNEEKNLFLNGFSPRRSGDVLFSLQRTWVPTLKEKEDKTNRYSKRNQVPLYFYGCGTDSIQKDECMMIDILPTLCDIMKIRKPYSLSGKSLFD